MRIKSPAWRLQLQASRHWFERETQALADEFMKLRGLVRRLKKNTPSKRKAAMVATMTLKDAFRFPQGRFRFKSRVPPGTDYFVEVSRDLKIWSPISKGTSTLEIIEYTDSDAFKFNHRFYRLRVDGFLSLNVVGYASITLPPGSSMIANPLAAPSNTVGEMFQGWPDGTTLNKFDTRSACLTATEVKSGKWTKPLEKLAPGEGAIFFNPTADYKSHSFVGEVTLGNSSIFIPAGLSVRSSLVPQPGSLEDLGFPVADGDVIHLFDQDRQKYILYPYADGKWTTGPPIVSMGESFWVAKKLPGTWKRSKQR